MDRRSVIRDFILDSTTTAEVTDDDDIFELGLVRSMFVMELVVFVEQEFGVSIAGEDLNFDHFRSIARVDELVARKVATV